MTCVARESILVLVDLTCQFPTKSVAIAHDVLTQAAKASLGVSISAMGGIMDTARLRVLQLLIRGRRVVRCLTLTRGLSLLLGLVLGLSRTLSWRRTRRRRGERIASISVVLRGALGRVRGRFRALLLPAGLFLTGWVGGRGCRIATLLG